MPQASVVTSVGEGGSLGASLQAVAEAKRDEIKAAAPVTPAEPETPAETTTPEDTGAETPETPKAEDAPAETPAETTPTEGEAAEPPAPGGWRGAIKLDGARVDMDLTGDQVAAHVQRSLNYERHMSEVDSTATKRAKAQIDSFFFGQDILTGDPADPRNPDKATFNPLGAFKWIEKSIGPEALKEIAMEYAGVQSPYPREGEIAEIDHEIEYLKNAYTDAQGQIDPMGAIEIAKRNREKNGIIAAKKSWEEGTKSRRADLTKQWIEKSRATTNVITAADTEKQRKMDALRDDVLGKHAFGPRVKTMNDAGRSRALFLIDKEAQEQWVRDGQPPTREGVANAYAVAVRTIAADYGIVAASHKDAGQKAAAAAQPRPSKSPPTTRGSGVPTPPPSGNGKAPAIGSKEASDVFARHMGVQRR